MVKFVIPYIENITSQLDREPFIVYYQALDVPCIQGGKEPRVVGDTVLSVERGKELIEKYGPRFRILANSCFPEWNNEVEDLCSFANRNNGSMVVARMNFAREIKNKYPNIQLHSSVIMNFYEDFSNILESPLFETVGGSQFHNDNTLKMIDMVPPKHRGRVLYLLLGCVWSRECIRHYELPSNQWKLGVNDIFRDGECTGRPGFSVDFEKLISAGFTQFKFGYRTPSRSQVDTVLTDYIQRYKLMEHRWPGHTRYI